MLSRWLNYLLTLWLIVLSWGCGRQIPLRAPHSFSPEEVKLYTWEDRCKLQSWFDSSPLANQVLFETGVVSRGPDGELRELGSVTHRVVDPRQRQKLVELLARYYRAVPRIARRGSFTVTMDYYRYCGKVRPLVGSSIRIDAGGRTVLLDYHPCIGEYLLNADLYDFRRLHLETRVASARTR